VLAAKKKIQPVLINSCPPLQLFESLGHMEDAHHSFSHQTGSNFMEGPEASANY